METTLVLRLETPLLLDVVDPDWPLRPHEVWRLWRWWAKTLVAGMLYDRGLLHGEKRQNAVKMPTREEAECIQRIVEKEMRLDVYNSCFRTQFEEIEFGPPREVTLNFKYQYGLHQVFQRDEKLWYIDRGSATLIIDEEHVPCSLDNKAIEAAMGTLALMFRLSCFGRGGRRGLGCFHVRAYGRRKELFEEEFATLIRRTITAIDAVVGNAVSRCRELQRRKTSRGLPPMPVLSMTRYDARIKDFAASPYTLLSVKGIRQEELYGFFSQQKIYEDKDKKEALKSWIIRGVSGRSPLMLRIDGNAAYLNVFVSADWPRELKLEWQRFQIEETDVLVAMAYVLREFIDYAEKHGGEVKILWPKG